MHTCWAIYLICCMRNDNWKSNVTIQKKNSFSSLSEWGGSQWLTLVLYCPKIDHLICWLNGTNHPNGMDSCRISLQWIANGSLSKPLKCASPPVKYNNKQQIPNNRHRALIIIYRTCKCFMCVHKSRSSRVPCTFILTANRSFSSKRTVAAAWKTMSTLEMSVWRSAIFIPRPANEQSPAIATILCRNFGTFARNCAKTWSSKISSSRVWMSRPFFGRTNK